MSEKMSSQQLRINSLFEAATSFTSESLTVESDLVSLKWFDYRFMSPLDATKHFLAVYQDVFRRKFRQEVDAAGASSVSGAHRLHFDRDRRERTQMWVARQRADVTGMRYQEYIEAAFDFALQRKRERFPRPNQLHFPGDANQYWQTFRVNFWNDRLDSGLARVEHPAFRIENYCGLPAQDDYRAFVLNQVKKGASQLRHAMLIYGVTRRQVPLKAFASLVPDDTFQQEIEALKSDLGRLRVEREALAPVTPDRLWLSCFGLPHAPNRSKPACATCPRFARCDRVAEKLKSKMGCESPVDDRRRAQARDRKRRQRERDKHAQQMLPVTTAV
ncbi:hypothetical protein [Mesorhizobium sp. ZC-5]|uniref:hypothetical protein n=1 Tax=Mesorhizobium sp. ZC-5 TaxID=2986066 RepID=UPI0021E6EB28|nr:hypothetical protein [Mesorhizobium sp. ZC-5]MCV3243291.1 hypothetical protein [Mesorhizobium sp. ZC-5]